MDNLSFADILAQTNQQNALGRRKGFAYNLADALAQTPVQQGYGSWLSGLTNAFGRAYQGRVESAIQQQKSQDLSTALQSGNLSDAAKVAAAYGDTGLAQQLLGTQATNEYRQAQLEESRLNREFNRAIKEQELAQKAAEDEAQRQYYLDQLGIKRDELAGTQAYRQGQLDIQRAGLEQDAAKLAQQAAENEAQRAYLMDKLGAETQLAQGEQALKQAQLEQTGAYNTARLAQEQAKLDAEKQQQQAMMDYYTGKTKDYSKMPLEALKMEYENKQKFVKETPQIGTLQSLDSMLNQNTGLYNTFDKDRIGREAYANQTGLESKIADATLGLVGQDKDERVARKTFDTLKKQSVVELRQQMKGQGQVSDQETDLLRTMEQAKNPYEFEIAGQALRQIMYDKVARNAELYGVENPTTARINSTQPSVSKGSQISDIYNRLKTRKVGQ